MWMIFQLLLLGLQLSLSFLVAYLLLLTFAARQAPRETSLPGVNQEHTFTLLIPAHNEELLLPSLLNSLKRLDYPASRFSIHVVADNCSDQTEAVARQGGAVVHARQNLEEPGKGFALAWLLQRLAQQGVDTDAFVILDADTLVSPNFLQVMSAQLGQGRQVIQAYYSVREAHKSWNSSLRYAALAVLHYLRPQGRMVLGGSAGLKGNGMVFRAEVLKNHQWSASITEDIEFHMSLVLAGERVWFAPDAVVWGEIPAKLSHSESQHDRWERGRLQMARKYVPQLLQAISREIRKKDFPQGYLFFDAFMEHLIPPFSILAGLTFLTLAASLLSVYFTPVSADLWSPGMAAFNLALAIFVASGQLVYLFSGLSMVRAPKSTYAALFFAPVLILWKITRYLRVIFQPGDSTWVRTSRDEVPGAAAKKRSPDCT